LHAVRETSKQKPRVRDKQDQEKLDQDKQDQIKPVRLRTKQNILILQCM
jgi:hypothetical protein